MRNAVTAEVTLLALCLACGGGKIVPMVSKSTFMVQASSDAEAIKDANAFCGRQGKTAIINPSVGRGSLARGEFIFMCASPGEPGIEPPNQPTEGN